MIDINVRVAKMLTPFKEHELNDLTWRFSLFLVYYFEDLRTPDVSKMRVRTVACCDAEVSSEYDDLCYALSSMQDQVGGL